MTEIASTKPVVTVDWSVPERSVAESTGDWGYHEPDCPFTPTPPDDRSPSGFLASQLMSELYGSFRGGLAPYNFLTAPDMGDRSFSRPDLIPHIRMALDCLDAIRHELLTGPRRTVWDSETGSWKIIVPSAQVETASRKQQKEARS